MSGPLQAPRPLVAVIVNNYNYGRYLRAAVDSALGQRYRPLQVIVVDDGSSDSSAAIMAAYGPQIEAVYQPNQGQAAAFNAGFARSRGEIVIFLDADDLLLPETAARVVQQFRAQPQLARVQYRLDIVDAQGQLTGASKPPPTLPLASGDLRSQVLSYPDDLRWQPTSGNAFAASVLRQILPMPVAPYRTCADYYLSNLTPLFGPVACLEESGGLYRLHGANNESGRGADAARIRDIVRRTAVTHEQIRRVAAVHLPEQVPGPEDLLSITFLANRLLSLKLDPTRHPLAGDTVTGILRQSVRAASRRRDVSPLRRAAYLAWFLLVAPAPAPLARLLAERFLYQESPRPAGAGQHSLPGRLRGQI